MGKFLIVRPLPIAAIAASRGAGVDNLKTRDPKEAWADSAVGSAATIDVDLGSAQSIDTVFVGYLRPPAAGATWTVQAGLAAPDEIALQPALAARVPDVAGFFPATSHALWFGVTVTARRLRITLTQPAGAQPLTAGVLVIGKAFAAELGREWGFGREPLDTGELTELSSGGFAVVEGARKVRTNWTFGDLSFDETDQLEQIALALGKTLPALVIEDADRTAGLRSRIHYGPIQWRAYERRNRHQTRWELSVTDWGSLGDPGWTGIVSPTPATTRANSTAVFANFTNFAGQLATIEQQIAAKGG